MSGLTSPNHKNHFNTFKILEEIVHPSFRDDWNTKEGEGGMDNRYDIMLVRIESEEMDAVIPATTIALNQNQKDLQYQIEQPLSLLRINHITTNGRNNNAVINIIKDKFCWN